MKSAIIAIVLSLLALQTDVLAAQSAQVILSAQDASQSVQLTDQRFEPIYAQQPYETTCSREVVDHVETRCETYNDSVCSGGGEVCQTTNDSVCNSNGCVSVPRRSCHSTAQTCHSVPRRACSDHNVYRTQHYSCTQYRTVAVGQRLVKTFNHQVEIALENPSAFIDESLQISITASENTISAKLSNSFNRNILAYQVLKLSEGDAGSVLNSSKKIVISMGLSAQVANQILSSSLQSLELGRNAIRFNLLNAAELAQNLNFAIKLVRNRAIGGDSVLFEGSIASSKLNLVAATGALNVLVPYEKLQIDSINSLKHDLSISVSLNAEKVLNASDFSAALNKRLGASLNRVKATF
jgi:hypothetical protein